MARPDVFYYNPTCEFSVANGSPHWHPNKLLSSMEVSMGNLPQFLAQPNDVVLVQKKPSVQLCEMLLSAGFQLPQYLELNSAINNPEFIQMPKANLRPWGWSPAVHRLFDPLKPSCHRRFLDSPVAQWLPEHREMFSRKSALSLLLFVQEFSGLPQLLPKTMAPQICQTAAEIEELCTNYPLMIKQPWSSSGRGLQRISNLPPGKMVMQKVGGLLKGQGYIIAEPLLDKVADLGLLYAISDTGVTFTGVSHFFTNGNGQYQGNFLQKSQVAESSELDELITHVIQHLPEWHIKGLQQMNASQLYTGPLGIDVLIYKDQYGQLSLHPVVEINWRNTMGHISLALESHIAEDSVAWFKTYFNPHSLFSSYSSQRVQVEPIRVEKGKLISGFLPLTEISGSVGFGAYLEVFPYITQVGST